MGRAVLSLQRDEQGNRSQNKKQNFWAMKAAMDRGEVYHDPAREEDILGRTKPRLELWEEHLKDPITALDKEVLGEPRTEVGRWLEASRGQSLGLQWPAVVWVPRFCKRCGKGPSGLVGRRRTAST